MQYEVDEGGGAFYGPKIDIKIYDAMGREWQGPTIQCDFNLPERFDMTYIGEDGERHRPVMVHRTVLGSMERFVGGLIEHYAGAFPVWLAPVQAMVIPIADRHQEYAKQVVAKLKKRGYPRRGERLRRPHAGARSATRRCRKCRTCSSSAIARRKRARSPSVCAAGRI